LKLPNLLIVIPLLLSACAHHVAPTTPAGQQAAVSTGGQTYTVQKGDYLHAIAKKLNVDQNQLAELNHLSPPYTIFPGQVLEVTPGSGAAVAAAAPAVTEEPVESAATPVQRTVESTPLAPIPAEKPAQVDRSSPAALAPPTQLTPQPAPAEPAVPSAADDGTGPSLVWPVKGDIVSSFGPKPGGLHNDGINIAAAEGTPVKAAAGGTVAYAGNELKGFGNLVLIRHDNGWVTAYAHMAQIAVKKGDKVASGQQIGTVGQTGSIDSPQLHFELRHGKDAVDPTAKLGA
jgi:murein DD-endopeptidase MepM/ murein hydrolase activator NlpD